MQLALGHGGDAAGCGTAPGPPAQAAAAPDFDSASWEAWYRHVSFALSSQLAAIDAGLGSGDRLWGAAAGGALAVGGPGKGKWNRMGRLGPWLVCVFPDCVLLGLPAISSPFVGSN
jgi:hypothetical protein